MPLPLPIHFIDRDGTVRDNAAVQTGKPSGYAPTPGYKPTMKLVRCLECRTVGVAEFVNGFNLRDADRLMDGKPIQGVCLRCRKETELVPIQLPPKVECELKILYDIQAALDEAVRRGEPIPADGLIWPLARVDAYRKWKEGQDGK
jgi:hypothetical protein